MRSAGAGRRRLLFAPSSPAFCNPCALPRGSLTLKPRVRGRGPFGNWPASSMTLSPSRACWAPSGPPRHNSGKCAEPCVGLALGTGAGTAQAPHTGQGLRSSSRVPNFLVPARSLSWEPPLTSVVSAAPLFFLEKMCPCVLVPSCSGVHSGRWAGRGQVKDLGGSGHVRKPMPHRDCCHDACNRVGCPSSQLRTSWEARRGVGGGRRARSLARMPPKAPLRRAVAAPGLREGCAWVAPHPQRAEGSTERRHWPVYQASTVSPFM